MVVRPLSIVAVEAEGVMPHKHETGSIAAFERTVHIASDEFSAIKQVSYGNCRRCLTVRWLTDESANGCLENIDAP